MPLLDPRSGPSYGTMETESTNMEEYEREQLLQEEYETEGESSAVSTLSETQEGVRKIEAINMTWTTRSLIVAYVRFVWLVVPCLSSLTRPLTWRKVYSSWHSARPWRDRL
jgi:hypothetical protein